MILPRWGDGIWPVDETYKRMTKFWDKLFVINFALILVPIVYHIMLRRSDARKKKVEYDFLNGNGEALPENQ